VIHKFSPGFAVVLAALVMLNAFALCASPFTQTAQPTHPCCPKHEPAPGCCVETGNPTIPAAAAVPEGGRLTGSPVAFPATVRLLATDAVAPVRPEFGSSGLFLHFHQLLI
jgi:hypothetical protein